MSNIRLLFLILIAPCVYICTIFFIAQSIGFHTGIFWDFVALIIVLVIPYSLYFAGANNKTYINTKSKDLKFNYLKEMFLFSAFFGTSLGISYMWYSITNISNSDSGEAWANLGSSMAIAILTDSYGFMYYFGTSLVQYFLEKKSEIKDKVTNRVQSKKIVSLLLLLVPFIITYFTFYLFLNNDNLSLIVFIAESGKLFLSYIFVIIFLAVLLVGSNFNIVIKSFLNNALEVNEVVETISCLKRLCRLIFISTAFNTLISTVSAGAVFVMNGIDMNYVFTYILLIFSLSTLIIIYLRTFIFRLNLDLVEMNHMQIDSDKYFIFKYIVPIYLLIHLLSGFGFIIMIFN